MCSRAIFTGALLALLLSACGDPPPPPIVLRLWRGPDAAAARERAAADPDAPREQAPGAGVDAHHVDEQWPGAVASRPAGQTLYATTFGARPGSGPETAWYRVAQDPEHRDVLMLRPFTPTDGKLGLQHKSGWAAVTTIPVGAGEALSVSVTARAPGAKPTPAAGAGPGADASADHAADTPVAALVELREPLDPDARLSAAGVSVLLDSQRHSTHELAGRLSREPRTVDAVFVTDLSTRYLALYLLAPVTASPAQIVVDSVQVTRIPLTDVVAAGGRFPRLQRLDERGAVRLALDREEREGLLALPGARYVFDLGPWALARRLDLAWGIAPRHAPGVSAPDAAADGDAAVRTPEDASVAAAQTGAIRLRVTARGTAADGAPFRVDLDEALRAPVRPEDPAWRDVTLALPASPEEPLLLELSAEAVGADPPLAVFGHPSVFAPRTAGPRDPTGPARGAAAARMPPNIVLISLDTLRPDRLHCYGGEAGLTPNLDALAAQGLRFTQASSTSSYTLPSHGSLLTGQYPAFHGAVDIDDRLSPTRSPFLAQLLADAGYVTAAFTGGGYVSPECGFAYGFDRYSSNDPVWALDSLRGGQLLETMSWEIVPMELPLLRRYAAPIIEDWIERQPEGVPFFLFLHTYVVHNYAPDRRWLERRGLRGADGSEQPFHHQDRQRFNAGDDADDADGGADDVAAADAAAYAALRDKVYAEYMPYYDATVGMADEFVGGVLAALDRAGRASNTLVLVTSDHGEEFGEHGFFGHGETLFESNTHVPLIVRLPAGTPESLAGRAPAVIDTPISLVDLAPWILRLAGIAPDPRMVPRAPLGPDTQAPPSRRQLFIELDTRVNRLSAVRDGPDKLHELLAGQGRGIEPGGTLLFDLATDPGETDDLSAARVSERTALARVIENFHALAEALHPRDGQAPLDLGALDPQLRERLEQLGYLGPGKAAPAVSPESR